MTNKESRPSRCGQCEDGHCAYCVEIENGEYSPYNDNDAELEIESSYYEHLENKIETQELLAQEIYQGMTNADYEDMHKCNFCGDEVEPGQEFCGDSCRQNHVDWENKQSDYEAEIEQRFVESRAEISSCICDGE